MIAAVLLLSTFGTDDMARYLLPASTKRFTVVSLASIRNCGLFTDEIQRGLERGIQQNEHAQLIAKLLEFDFKNLDVFMFCETGVGGNPDQTLAILTGKFAYEKATKALAEMGKSGELTTMSFNDQPVYFNHRDKEASYFTLIEGGTLVFSRNKNLIKDALQGLTDLREPKKELADGLDNTRVQDFAIRLVGEFPEDAKKNLQRSPQFKELAKDLVAYNVVGHLGQNPGLAVRLTMTNDKAAAQSVATLNGLLQIAKPLLANNPRKDLVELLDKLSLKSDKADMVAEIAIPQQMFADMVTQSRKDRQRFEERRKAREAEMKKKQPGADAPKQPQI